MIKKKKYSLQNMQEIQDAVKYIIMFEKFSTYKEIWAILKEKWDVKYCTFQKWITRDQANLKTNINQWKIERLLNKAEATIDRALDDKNMKIALDAAKHVTNSLENEIWGKERLTEDKKVSINFGFNVSTPTHQIEIGQDG